MFDALMDFEIPLPVWIATVLLAVGGCVFGWLRWNGVWRTQGEPSLSLTSLALLVPLATLLLFLRVFVIGQSSNVAQVAGEEGFELWSSWADAWPFFFLGNPCAALMAVIALFLRPRIPGSRWTLVVRLLAVVAAALSWWFSAQYFPDA